MPATAIPAWVRFDPGCSAQRLDQRPDVGGERLELDRGRGSAAMWRSVWRTTPACSDAWKAISVAGADDQLGRASADVDHERRLAGGLSARRAQVGQPRLLLAVEHPCREREALAELGDEGAAVGASRTALVAIASIDLGTGGAVDLDIVGDRVADGLDRFGRQLAGQVDPAAEPRHPVCRSTSAHRPSSTSATSSRVELVPMSTTATLWVPSHRRDSRGARQVLLHCDRPRCTAQRC